MLLELNMCKYMIPAVLRLWLTVRLVFMQTEHWTGKGWQSQHHDIFMNAKQDTSAGTQRCALLLPDWSWIAPVGWCGGKRAWSACTPCIKKKPVAWSLKLWSWSLPNISSYLMGYIQRCSACWMKSHVERLASESHIFNLTSIHEQPRDSSQCW